MQEAFGNCVPWLSLLWVGLLALVLFFGSFFVRHQFQVSLADFLLLISAVSVPDNIIISSDSPCLFVPANGGFFTGLFFTLKALVRLYRNREEVVKLAFSVRRKPP